MQKEGQVQSTKINASQQNLEKLLACQGYIPAQNRESSLQSTQNIDVQQYYKKVIPQIRSQQLSPVGIPLSRAFSQTCRRYKVKINTNNSAIPKDFFSNIICCNETNSNQIQEKENNQKLSNNMKQNIIINSSQKQDGFDKSSVIKNQSSNFLQDFSNAKKKSNICDQRVAQKAQDLLKPQIKSNNFQNQCMEIQLSNNQDSKLAQFDQLNEQTFIQNITTPKFVEKKLVFGNQNDGIEKDFNDILKSQRKISSAKRVQRNFIRSQLQQQQDIVQQNSYQVEHATTKNLFEQTSKIIKRNKNQFFEIKDVDKQIQKQTSLEIINKNLMLTNQENNQLSNLLINKGNLSYSKRKCFQNSQNSKILNSDINNVYEISKYESSTNKNQIIQLTKSSYSCDQEECRVVNSDQIIKNRDKIVNQASLFSKTGQKNQIQKKVKKINIKNEQSQEEQVKIDNQGTNINCSSEINDCNQLANMITLTNEFIFNKQIIKQSEKQDIPASNSMFSQLNLKNQNISKSQQQIEKQPNNSVQNSKMYEDLNEFSFKKINKNWFQDIVQQQKQINSQNNSCKKLSDCYKNNSNEVFPQLFIIDSDYNFNLNQYNQRLLDNRSTTTSQLTKRQQILYLQGQLKKRNQLSLHEDYNSKQNQPQQQQQQQLQSNPKKDIQKKYNIDQNFNEKQLGEPFSLQNLMLNSSFEKFESNYNSSKSQQLEHEGFLNQQFSSNQNEQLPKLYPTKVNYKSQKDRNFSLNYLKKQNLAESQYQINSSTYTNSNIDNYSQILNPQTCNNFNQSNISVNVDLNSMTKNLIPLSLVKGQIFSNYSHKEKIQTSDTTPSSKQELSKMNFQLLKYEQQLYQKNNESPQSFIKIEQDTEDILFQF
ncbi:hypothetical protein ABPG72_019366 [Tetrahymena utriculariae]